VHSEWTKYPGYPHTMLLSQETLRKAREAFLAIGNGNLPDLIGFSNNHKEDKSLAYQSLLDAVGEHVSDATKLVMYRQLYDNNNQYAGFVDLSQGIDESIAHYLPEAKKYAALRNNAIAQAAHASLPFSPLDKITSLFKTGEEKQEEYIESYLSLIKLKSDAPAFMRKDARIDLGLTVTSVVPWGTGYRIGFKLIRGGRTVPRNITVETNGKRFSRKLENGHEPDNELWSGKAFGMQEYYHLHPKEYHDAVKKMVTALMRRKEYQTAYGYYIEAKVIKELGDASQLQRAGYNVGVLIEKTDKKGGVSYSLGKSDIDAETIDKAYQIKSGGKSMSDSQGDVTAGYAKRMDKKPVLMYNANLIKPDNQNLMRLKKKYPHFKFEPRYDWSKNPAEFMKELSKNLNTGWP